MSAYDKKIQDLVERELPQHMCHGQHEVSLDKLALGDLVKLGDYPYDWATVVYLDDEVVKVYRPYVHVSPFSYGSGNGSKLIPYLGHEEVTMRRADTRKVTAIFRSTVPE